MTLAEAVGPRDNGDVYAVEGSGPSNSILRGRSGAAVGRQVESDRQSLSRSLRQPREAMAS